MTRLVVGGDGNVDEFERCIGVAESNNGDVHVRRLTDGLVVNSRVGDDDDAGLLERPGDVVGEVTGCEAASDCLCAGVCGELENSTVSVGTGGNGNNVVGVLDSGDYPGSEDNLFPGLSNVEDVDACAESAQARH
jgi:hypothetical protein